MTTPFTHQSEVLEINPACVLLAHSTGTGKTLTGIWLANKNVKSLLIVCPKMLKEKWQRDCDKYLNQDIERIILSKEEFKKYAKELKKYQGVLIDEAHYFAGMKSQMYKAMKWYLTLHETPYRYLLTATPYLSTPLNIYALAVLLGHQWHYRNFIEQFFHQIPMGHRMVLKQRNNMEGAVAELVSRIGHIVDMEDIVDVPEQTHEVIKFPLNKEQLKAKTEYAFLESTHIQQWTKEHQIENGFVYTLEDETIFFDTNKTKEVLRLAEENKKLVIFCRYRAQIQLYADLLVHRQVFKLHGGIDNRDAIINEANASDDCVIIIQSACSAGYELPSFDTMVFASLDFSYVNYAQALGRILRINELHENKFIFLVTEGVDSAVYDSIMNKRDFSFEIYGKGKLDEKTP